MAFPASQQTLDAGLNEASLLANQLKLQVQSLRDRSGQGSTRRESYLALQAQLSSAITRWAAIGAIPGLAAYAQAQYGNAGLNIATEFTAMRNAAIVLRDWIFNNFPKDVASGALFLTTTDVSGVQTSLEFSSAQVSGFRTAADAFTATVA